MRYLEEVESIFYSLFKVNFCIDEVEIEFNVFVESILEDIDFMAYKLIRVY